jgi:hypothetical protein
MNEYIVQVRFKENPVETYLDYPWYLRLDGSVFQQIMQIVLVIRVSNTWLTPKYWASQMWVNI